MQCPCYTVYLLTVQCCCYSVGLCFLVGVEKQMLVPVYLRYEAGVNLTSKSTLLTCHLFAYPGDSLELVVTCEIDLIFDTLYCSDRPHATDPTEPHLKPHPFPPDKRLKIVCCACCHTFYIIPYPYFHFSYCL